MVLLLSIACGSKDKTTETKGAEETVSPTETVTTPSPTPNCETLYWLDDSSQECAPKEFCESDDYIGVQTFETLAECEQTLADLKPAPKTRFAEEPAIGTSWAYETKYDVEATKSDGTPISEHNITIWDITVTKKDAVEGADCYTAVLDIEGDSTRWYYYAPMEMSIEVLLSGGDNCWGIAAHDLLRETSEFFVDFLGGWNLEVSRITIADEHPAQLSVGNIWHYRTLIDLGMDIGAVTFTEETDWTAEVVGTEEITVPLGTFDCYRVEARTGDAVNYFWWAIDEDFICPVKYTMCYTFMGEQVNELISYTIPE